MSDRQVIAYENVRDDERSQEKRGKKAEKRKRVAAIKDEIMDVASSYRVFSRQTCNFVFPDGVERVYPSDVRTEVRINERRAEEPKENSPAGAEVAAAGGGAATALEEIGGDEEETPDDAT
jgi:hypothetical protein